MAFGMSAAQSDAKKMPAGTVVDKVLEFPRTQFRKRILPKNRYLQNAPTEMLNGEKLANGIAVFGRLEIEGSSDAKKVGTWMPIIHLQNEAQRGYPVGNYFSGVMYPDRQCVSFVKFGYETIKVPVPEAKQPFSDETICNLGVLKMRKLLPEEAGAIEFTVSLPKGVDSAFCNIALCNECPITPRDCCMIGSGMIIPWSDAFSKEVHAGEKVRLDGCTPGLYNILIFQLGQPGEMTPRSELHRFVDVVAGKTQDLGSLELSEKRQCRIAVRLAADKGAAWNQHTPMDGMLDARSFVNAPKADGGNHFLFQVLGYRKEGSAIISISTADLQIADLGRLSGKKFNQLEAKGKLPAPVPVKIREYIKGHPELMSQYGKCVLQKDHIYRLKQLDGDVDCYVAFDVRDL